MVTVITIYTWCVFSPVGNVYVAVCVTYSADEVLCLLRRAKIVVFNQVIVVHFSCNSCITYGRKLSSELSRV